MKATTGLSNFLDLTDDLRELGVPGLSAVIVKNGKTVATGVAGIADTNRNKPVVPDTIFTWASVSKTVTATALMQLYDQGMFGLDDDINDYLGFEVRLPAHPNQPITFRHLLTHTSGIRDSKIYDALYVQGDSPIGLGEFIEGYLKIGGRYYDAKRNFRRRGPGASYKYSNIGAGVIGYLVEVLSGMPFEEYTAENIFNALGMTNTSFRLTGLDTSMIALPNGNGALQGFPTFPDGTLRSSPSNLARFFVLYMNGGKHGDRQILKPRTIEEMLRSQTRANASQGLIWYTDRFGKKALWGHGGDDPGISSNMFFDPPSSTGVLLAANGEWKDDARKTMRKLLRLARTF